MTLNIEINREKVAAVVGFVVLLFAFVTLMWFPGTFLAIVANLAWFIIILGASVVIAGLVMLGVYNGLGALTGETDDEDDDEEEE